MVGTMTNSVRAALLGFARDAGVRASPADAATVEDDGFGSEFMLLVIGRVPCDPEIFKLLYFW
jgi:hypothetical protein